MIKYLKINIFFKYLNYINFIEFFFPGIQKKFISGYKNVTTYSFVYS